MNRRPWLALLLASTTCTTSCAVGVDTSGDGLSDAGSTSQVSTYDAGKASAVYDAGDANASSDDAQPPFDAAADADPIRIGDADPNQNSGGGDCPSDPKYTREFRDYLRDGGARSRCGPPVCGSGTCCYANVACLPE